MNRFLIGSTFSLVRKYAVCGPFCGCASISCVGTKNIFFLDIFVSVAMYNDGLWIYMRCLKDTPHPPPRFQLGLPRLLIPNRRMTVLAGVFYGASSKSVPSMAFPFKHTRVCLLALSMTEHAWRPLRSAQTLWWHPFHNRQTFWVSFPLSACVLCDHMDPRPDGACAGEWVQVGGATLCIPSPNWVSFTTPSLI